MAWERRRNGIYYYRAHKVRGRVIKEYVGTGPLAEIAAERGILARTARATAVAFWIALSAAIIIVGQLVREGWCRYRWDGRPPRRP